MDGRRGRLNAEMVPSTKSVVHKTASATLAFYEQRCTVDSTLGAVTITLPPVTEAVGRCYSIICTTFVSAVTIADNDDSYSWADETSSVAAAGDGALYYSDGFTWWNLSTIT